MHLIKREIGERLETIVIELKDRKRYQDEYVIYVNGLLIHSYDDYALAEKKSIEYCKTLNGDNSYRIVFRNYVQGHMV